MSNAFGPANLEPGESRVAGANLLAARLGREFGVALQRVLAGCDSWL